MEEALFRKTARDPWPPLAGAIRPFGRLGALVFRLTSVRKSHGGLARPSAKTRIAGRALVAKPGAPAGKTFAELSTLDLSPSFRPGQTKQMENSLLEKEKE
jgi:hypothetical protein